MTPTTPTSTPAQQAMQDLTAQWYNAVVTGCSLDAKTFQLAQGYPVIGNLSQDLWDVIDAVPPLSVTGYWNPSQLSSYSSLYGAVITGLQDPAAQAFDKVMGDYLPAWIKYKTSDPPPTLPKGGMYQLFETWEQLNMPDGQGEQALNRYAEIADGAIEAAQGKWNSAFGQALAYDKTIEDFNNAITPQSGGCSASMESSTASTTISNSWANGEAVGLFDFFGGAGTGNWDEVTTQVASAGVTVEADFKHQATFSARPLAVPSKDPVLQSYVPWYEPSAMNLAYTENNDFVWQGTLDWDDVFGPSGSLQYVLSSLVLVSGVTVKATAATSFDSSEQAQIQHSSEYGFFPFFAAESSGGWSNEVTFDSSGAMTATSTVPDGVIVVLGVEVTPASAQFVQTAG